MSNRTVPGESLSRRVASRDGGLMRRTMSDGGEVYSGPLARRALRALGARAMTMDHTILVDDDFDESNPEDQALYAHERFHQMESGGADHSNDLHDAEEMGAQAVERMVLHRAHAGEDFGAIMRDVKSGGGAATADDSPRPEAPTMDGQNDNLSPEQKAYMAMRKQGKSHFAIVNELARRVVQAMEAQEKAAPMRGGTSRW